MKTSKFMRLKYDDKFYAFERLNALDLARQYNILNTVPKILEPFADRYVVMQSGQDYYIKSYSQQRLYKFIGVAKDTKE